jgi:hypothetical protein
MGTDTWPPDMLLNLQLGLMLCRVMEGDPAAVRAEDLFDAATMVLSRLAPFATRRAAWIF